MCSKLFYRVCNLHSLEVDALHDIVSSRGWIWGRRGRLEARDWHVSNFFLLQTNTKDHVYFILQVTLFHSAIWVRFRMNFLITYSWLIKGFNNHPVWNKTTLITGGVGGAGVVPPSWKKGTIFLWSLVLSVPIHRNFQSNGAKWRSLKLWVLHKKWLLL